MLKLSKTTSPNKQFNYDCVTLYIKMFIDACVTVYCVYQSKLYVKNMRENKKSFLNLLQQNTKRKINLNMILL